MAFINSVPVGVRPVSIGATSFARVTRAVRAAPVRRASVRMLEEDKSIPQGFTFFSETLNGRAAMLGFTIALLTEAITGKGIVGQVASVFDVIHSASALIH